MSAVAVLAELVAALEREAAALQAATAASESELRAAAARSVSALRGLRSQAALAVAQDAMNSAAGPPPTSAQPSCLSGLAGYIPAPLGANPLPSQPPQDFDRESLAAVVAHMTKYEASPKECSKALKALTSLAYANAAIVGNHAEALPQVLRILRIHPGEEKVLVGGAKALCNMSYDADVALKKLSSNDVIGAFVKLVAVALEAGGQSTSSKEVCVKASEAIARVVAAEVGPQGGAEGTAVPPEQGPLRILFTVTAYEDAAGRKAVVKLVDDLVKNEVATPDFLVQRLVDLANQSGAFAGATAAAWLMLIKQVAMAEIADTFSDALIQKNGIGSVSNLMLVQPNSGLVQLAGMEAMSALIGTSIVGLQAFADSGGVTRIETAMSNHPDDTGIQTKGIRSLASGVVWPEEIRVAAKYDFKNGIRLTKAAMAKHPKLEELQSAGLEALRRYFEKAKCLEQVKEDGGIDLVKEAVTLVYHVEKARKAGESVLASLGEKDWKPEGVAENAA